MKKHELLDRIRKTVYNALSLSFLTWVAVLVCYYVNNQTIDMNFLLFTAAVIGIKSFKPNTPAGGATA